MNDVPQFDPQAILESLDRHGVRYVLIGGIAAALHGSPHVTFDVDISPERSRPNLTALAAALEDLDARVRVEQHPAGIAFDHSAEMLERVEILNLVTRFGALDLTFVPSGTRGYDDLKRSAEPVDVGGLLVPVASLDDVIRSKEAAGREKDRAVLPSLRRLQRKLAEPGGDERPGAPANDLEAPEQTD
ncbi:MAG: hypothetical protein OEU54_13905 [Gemmatimonadota bacterium]|nr:hypothetical protein [Gemmatimonadota bacterium]